LLPGLLQISYCLFGGVGRTGRKEGRQFADIGLLGGGEVIAICRAAAARAALARLAHFALSLCRLLDIAFNGRGSHRLGGLLAGSGGSLLDFAFRPEAIAIALTVAARLAFAILAILALALLALLAGLVALALFLALGLHILLLRRGLRRREPRVHLGHVVIVIVIVLAFRPLAALGLLGARNDAEIVLGMLEIILRHHRIAARLGVAGELEIFLGDMGRVAANLHIRSIALEIAGQRIDVLASAIPATLPVLVILVVGSHLVALSNSRKISVTLLADRHLPGLANSGTKPPGLCNRLYLAS